MTDELPEWPADAPAEDEEQIDTATPLEERLADMLHRALNDKPIHIGPQVVTKWIVIAEVQGADHDEPALRWIDSDVSEWDRTGMLQYVLDEERHSRTRYAIAMMADDDEDGLDA